MSFLTYSAPLNKQIDKRTALEGLGKIASNLNKIVFLSHSFRDKTHLKLVEEFFKNFDAGIFTDEGEKNLPTVPSPKTTQILKGNIYSYQRFIILVSPESQDLHWIPWELGLADGLKGVSKMALLPVTLDPDGEEWSLHGHLGLYPLIYSEKKDDSIIWRVYDPRDKKAWKLKFWLHSNIA